MSTIAIFGLATFIPVARRHWTMIRFVAIFEQLLRGVAYMYVVVHVSSHSILRHLVSRAVLNGYCRLQLSNLSLEKIFEVRKLLFVVVCHGLAGLC